MTKRPATPYGWTIFCDDVRHEVSGKTTLVGIYNNHLITKEPFPAMLPQLWIVPHLFQRPAECGIPVRIRAWMPGIEEPVVDVSQDIPLPGNLDAPSVNKEDPILMLGAHFRLAPVLLVQEGALRVEAQRGDLDLSLGQLWLTHSESATPISKKH